MVRLGCVSCGMVWQMWCGKVGLVGLGAAGMVRHGRVRYGRFGGLSFGRRGTAWQVVEVLVRRIWLGVVWQV